MSTPAPNPYPAAARQLDLDALAAYEDRLAAAAVDAAPVKREQLEAALATVRDEIAALDLQEES